MITFSEISDGRTENKQKNVHNPNKNNNTVVLIFELPANQAFNKFSTIPSLWH